MCCVCKHVLHIVLVLMFMPRLCTRVSSSCGSPLCVYTCVCTVVYSPVWAISYEHACVQVCACVLGHSVHISVSGHVSHACTRGRCEPDHRSAGGGGACSVSAFARGLVRDYTPAATVSSAASSHHPNLPLAPSNSRRDLLGLAARPEINSSEGGGEKQPPCPHIWVGGSFGLPSPLLSGWQPSIQCPCPHLICQAESRLTGLNPDQQGRAMGPQG